ncbi:MAG: STAS domain-containing protein [bacterium]
MNINIERENEALFVLPGGRIDGNNAHEFHNALTEAITDQDDTVVMDLSNLTYISSAGLRAILLTAKALQKRDAKFMLCSLKATIKGVFEISGFDKIIAIYDSRETALTSIGKSAS